MITRPLESINKIIIHCSDSLFGNVEEISHWHKQRGFDTIGYHFVIYNNRSQKDKSGKWINTYYSDGDLRYGRKVPYVGAHCRYHNSDSIGICLVGVDEFSDEQMETLKNLVKYLIKLYNIEFDNVVGHNELSEKPCPNFNVREWVNKELKD